MIRFFAIIFTVLLASCALLGTGNKQPVKTLNNNGGFTHGGLTIELMDDGSALATTYSDAIGDSKSRRVTYELNQDLLVIRYPSGSVTRLQKVTYKGKEYWVDPSEVSRLIENSDAGEWRRHVALKSTREQAGTSNGG